MKKVILLPLIVIILIACQLKSPDNHPDQSKPVESQSTSSSPITDAEGSVPLPSEKDVVNAFFRLINEKRINEAFEMMSPAILSDNSQKQAWEAQFNAMQSVNVVAAEKTLQSEWTDAHRTLTVVINVVMDPASVTALIPFYGYENGCNIRWITLEKNHKLWKVTSISTGP